MSGLEAFLDSPGGLATKAALAAAFLDFAFGVFASLRDESFSFDALAAFLRKHIMGRVAPVTLLAYMGYITGEPTMIGAAGIALAAYTAETLGSIYGSINPADAKAVDPNVVEVNPIPKD